MDWTLFFLVPIASIAALGFALFFYKRMKKSSEGTPQMRRIAASVREGADSYLRQQYKIVGYVFAVVFALFAFMAYAFHIQNPWVPFAFLTGGALFGIGRLLGDEDCNLRFRAYGERRTHQYECRIENRLP